VQNTIRVVVAVAVGLIVGRWGGLVIMLLAMSTGLLVGLVLRIVAHERNTTVSMIARVAFAFGVATLAGRLIGWFGVIGGLLALVLIGVALVAAGADIA